MVEVEVLWAAIPALLAGLTGAVIAAWIFSRRPGSTEHRAVAMFVWTISFGWAVSYGLSAFGDAAGAFWRPAFKTAYFSWSLGLVAYLWIVSTLPTPVARGLARPAVLWSATVALLVVALVYGTTPFLASSVLGMGAGALFDLVWMGIILAGSLVAFSAWRSAPPGLVRRKHGLFAIAFIVHDASLLAFLGSAWAFLNLFPQPPDLLGPWYLAVPGVATLLFQALLLYGILSTQLFDIDLRLKRTLRRGTLVGAFLGVFVVVAAIVEQWLQQYGVLLGGLAVGLMLLALRPIERAADRLAERAMPAVQDTAEYRTVRKREVYRAAIESALREGDITEKERGMLATFASELGLTPKETHDIEREARAARGAAA
ncbi:MAG TPA: hypothetical protein VM582_05775 [Candidatus Thermoplasmatota archaeon]|nr:hypothetical protein [Candidatus Thermoplasmatota archaeon]